MDTDPPQTSMFNMSSNMTFGPMDNTGFSNFADGKPRMAAHLEQQQMIPKTIMAPGDTEMNESSVGEGTAQDMLDRVDKNMKAPKPPAVQEQIAFDKWVTGMVPDKHIFDAKKTGEDSSP